MHISEQLSESELIEIFCADLTARVPGEFTYRLNADNLKLYSNTYILSYNGIDTVVSISYRALYNVSYDTSVNSDGKPNFLSFNEYVKLILSDLNNKLNIVPKS